jgi:hypothetical protein
MKRVVIESAKFFGIGVAALLVVMTSLVGLASADILCVAQNDNAVSFADNVEHTRQCCTTGVIPATSKVAILFNAECAVSAADDGTYVDTDLELDGVKVYRSSRAVCSSAG